MIGSARGHGQGHKVRRAKGGRGAGDPPFLSLLSLSSSEHRAALWFWAMSHTTTDSDKKMLPKDQVGSPSIDEGSSGGSMISGGPGLKKGPWTAAEDAILVDYVKKHGEGNWNAVQKHSGLSRCGKSCRLRWANHLRPNLKKGAFTPEEEQLIVELHSKMGNKWARMAAHLPGRTDNEIKNYWNTRIKRRQRAGLPIYPPELSFPTSNENQQSQTGDFRSIDKMQNEVLRGNGYDIPDIIFDDFKVSSYGSPFLDISFGSMLGQGFGSQSYGFNNQPLDCKPLRVNETLFPVYPANMSNGLPEFENFSNGPSEKINLTLGASYPYDPDPLCKNLAPYEGANPGSHAFMNGNYSTSRSLSGAVKPELPSLQYSETDPNCWIAYASSPQSEAVDTYIQSPPPVSVQSDCSSPRNSGLLEEVLHESQALHTGKKHASDKSSNSSAMTPSDLVDSSVNNFCDGPAWEDGDPISPLGCSAASVFNEYTPPVSGSPLDELPPSGGPSGSDIVLPSAEDVSTSNTVEGDIKLKPDFLRPDALLGSDWLLESSQMAKDRTDMNNALATLLGDGCCGEHKPLPTENSSFSGGLGLDSYPWNNMPRVCQMSELP